MFDFLMFVEMVKNLLHLHPEKRMTPHQVRDHPFARMHHLACLHHLSSYCLPLMRGLWGASFQNVHLEEMKETHQLHFSLTLPQFLYMPPPLLLLYRSPLLMRLPLSSSSATVNISTVIIYHPEHSEKKSITYANIKPNTVCNSAFIKQMQRPKKNPLKYTETLHRATDDKNYLGKFKEPQKNPQLVHETNISGTQRCDPQRHTNTPS
ncbi:hypothetical protein ACER0C_011710 [Sarotherodon galilaeus]